MLVSKFENLSGLRDGSFCISGQLQESPFKILDLAIETEDISGSRFT